MVPGVPAEAGGAGRPTARQPDLPAPRAVSPRDASTTVLLRDAPGGLEAYLMVRSTRLAAFAGMTVFPGGSVDQGDRYAEPLWRGPDPADWPLAADPELSRALVVAAVRETFEEIGVLLAAPEHDPADFPSEAELAADRAVLESGQATLPGLLRARGLVIRTGLLAPWAHWITPEVEKRRFDTRFFVAELPAGQEVQQPSGEASRALWARPSDALETVRRGELGMLPPTASTLFSLAQFDTVADVFAAAASRAIRPIRPQYVVKDGVGQLVLPPEDAELVPDDGFLAELMAAVSRRLQ